MPQGDSPSDIPERLAPFSVRTVPNDSRARAIYEALGLDRERPRRGFRDAGYWIADAIVRLGGYGNPAIWELTPRQLSAYLFIKDKVDKEDAVTRILHQFYSSQATPEAVNRVLEDIREELR